MKRIVQAVAAAALAAGAVFGVAATISDSAPAENTAASMTEYAVEIVAGAYK
ncbi:hypothetical protein LWC34_08320 [Kibdelosporangium philippinense]|uniref:DUF2613 domain-containing protein n=1 Tax=Kibdelosporangium philippinense TaxID=211113 RepID=A0ABS8Z4K6_9PSEU|nr:hypothetical protein [Kibdelosporangium philippinense]MCE7002834.1 hypothetical protein [Kibdelosporangium philippinense]